MKYRKSRYTPDFKLRVLLALEANGGNLDRTAEQFDVPRSTILDWNRHFEQIAQQATESHDREKVALTARIDLSLRQLVNSLPEKIENAKLTDSLRAIAMLDQLRAAFASRESQANSTQAREKLARILANYIGADEESIIPEGGYPQIEAFHKARNQVDTVNEANDAEEPSW